VSDRKPFRVKIDDVVAYVASRYSMSEHQATDLVCRFVSDYYDSWRATVDAASQSQADSVRATAHVGDSVYSQSQGR
jgi:hypothetical protein